MGPRGRRRRRRRRQRGAMFPRRRGRGTVPVRRGDVQVLYRSEPAGRFQGGTSVRRRRNNNIVGRLSERWEWFALLLLLLLLMDLK